MARRAEKPLSGLRVLVTRPRHQAGAFLERLRQLGADPIELSLIEIAPLEDYSQLDSALERFDRYDLVIFTSANGVAAVFDRLGELCHPERSAPSVEDPSKLGVIPNGAREARPHVGPSGLLRAGCVRNPRIDLRGRTIRRSLPLATLGVGMTRNVQSLPPPPRDDTPHRNMRVIAIGPATAAALTERGVNASWFPSEYVAEAIVREIGDVAGQKILLPRADIARSALADGLRARGAIVDAIVAYRTVAANGSAEALNQILDRGVDMVTFLSSSTVSQFASLVDRSRLTDITIACIGPITAGTAKELGLRVDIVANEYTAQGLVEAMTRHWDGKP